MKRLFLLLLMGAALAGACTHATKLPADDWDPAVHASLSAMIRAEAGADNYAVFDCDNTVVLHDLMHTLMLYLIENLRFKDAPAQGFIGGITDPDTVLEGCCGLTARALGQSLSERLAQLQALLSCGVPMDSLRRTETYLDYRARFLAMYKGIGRSCSYGEICLWMPSLMAGMSLDEARAVADQAQREAFAAGKVWRETWVSPDGRFRAEAEKGLVRTERVRHLIQTLRDNGIDVYICSASPEWLVELFACDTRRGFGLDSSRVFGIRMCPSDTVRPAYRADYPQPFKEGKVENIRAFMAPAHGGKDPVLVGGDSVGDLAMLTAFPGMKTGLLMDRARTDAFADLVRQAREGENRGRYLAQEVDY